MPHLARCLVTTLAGASLAACASSQTLGVDRETAPRARVQLDLGEDPAQLRTVFPSAIEPRLPSVDRIAGHVRSHLGETAVASIELCVDPDGHVTKVAMVEGTASPAFDAAVLRDAERWRFAALPGGSSQRALQTCERATVKYLVR
ncbi:MAG: energy transducer TonB [Myxococcota bacterium]|nr:energy transducer TonB [Myxococcota bacterium]